MTQILQAQPRLVLGRKVRALRRQKRIPGIVYGRGVKSKPIEFDQRAFIKLWEEAGESTLIDLTIGQDKPVKVLIAQVDKDPVSDEFIHVDFHQVRMEEKITAEIDLDFVGIAPAVKEFGGILVKNINQVEVSCLPGDLVHSIEVDLSSLKTFADHIYIKDIKIPPGIKVLEGENEIVAGVIAPRSEEELKALEEKPVEEVEKVEKVEKEKKEGEEEASKETVKPR